MLTINELTEEQARRTLDEQELPEELRTSSKFSALMATQDWCPDSSAVSRWMKKHARKGLPEDIDVTVYTVHYNKLPFFDEFREMKEQVWQNFFIPYIRYYQDGSLIDESNRVSADDFFATFRHSGAA
ncbi:MAG: hypothetical protein ACOC0B_00710 [bacterium]